MPGMKAFFLAFAFSMLASTWGNPPAFAEATASSSTSEPIQIGTLLHGATSYQGHSVAVIGMAKEIKTWPPVRGGRSCGINYDSYSFTVEDASGSIQVVALGTCQIQGVVKPVREGDRVIVEGIFIQPTSHETGSPPDNIYIKTPALGIRNVPE